MAGLTQAVELRPQPAPAGFLMRPTKQPKGVGNHLIRLKDLPLETRLAALQRALRTAKTEQEARRMLLLTIDPQDAGGRIAA